MHLLVQDCNIPNMSHSSSSSNSNAITILLYDENRSKNKICMCKLTLRGRSYFLNRAQSIIQRETTLVNNFAHSL